MLLNLAALIACAGTVGADPPVVTVRADDTVIDRSCRVVIPEGLVIADTNGNGVIHITAPDITVEFAPGSVLRGAAATGVDPDQYAGVGIRLDGQKGVTIRGARVAGYKVGIWASKAPALTIEDCDASGNWRQHLRSTAAAEDGADWLYPHHNDNGEWTANYGGAIYIKDSEGVSVRRCRVRRGQNGLLLDRVNDSKVYDNDFSFLSGWGVAMWRSSRNVVCRNGIDFCVRGYSHGVYNRGQDSAGILLFEQCSKNVIAENSVTHGGDGFFGFAGVEALGDVPPPGKDFDYTRKGCNDNLLIKNDLSYAPAHGIEMTFSFGNKFISNRLVENNICGVWGGYSQDTLIANNTIEGNGAPRVRAEGGGVNIEHGFRNLIVANHFARNCMGVSLWLHPAEQFMKSPWAKANHKGSKDNRLEANTFDHDELAIRLVKTTGTLLADNRFTDVEEPINADADSITKEVEGQGTVRLDPEYPVFGDTRPVGARPALRGRQNIVMTEWGPWDHESPLVQPIKTVGGERVWALHNLPGSKPGDTTGDRPRVDLIGQGMRGVLEIPEHEGRPWIYRLLCTEPGVHPFTLKLAAGDFAADEHGTFVNAKWNITVFPTPDYGPKNPPPDLEAWRALAKGPLAKSAVTDSLSLKFGGGGPSDIGLSDEITAAKLPRDHFGTIATAALHLTRGRYRFKTLSDDGVRVLVDGKPVIERWNWHGPTPDAAEVAIDQDRDVPIVVEHFEIDGYAVLELTIEPIE